jgi:NADPH-dependent ferric siderophore reductase
VSDPTFDFFHPHVVRTQRLSPNLLRVVLGGAGLARVVSGGRDQRFKLFLPRPGRPTPVLPDVLDTDWYMRWRALDPDVRAVMRTYTVSAARQDPPEIDVDFALHGDLGPASRWAARARPGDGVALLAPVTEDNGGVSFCPPAGTDWVLLAADDTALPAVANILATLPAGLPVRVFIEVGHPDDRMPLPTEADAEITWLVRAGQGRDRTAALLDAVTAAGVPEGAVPYAWLAGESGCVRALRRHLVAERGMERKAVTFTGYWRQGRTEDDLLTEAIAEVEVEVEVEAEAEPAASGSASTRASASASAG